MINKENFKALLKILKFEEHNNNYFIKKFEAFDAELIVDFSKQLLIYPESTGLKVNERQTCNFSSNENFVVFECVHRLLTKGYKPNHIELEPRWQVGHGASGGRADIMVKDNTDKSLLIIECKTSGKEFDDAWKKTLVNGGQVLSYCKQAGSTQYVCLYSSDIVDENLKYFNYIISLNDNLQFLEEHTEKKPLSYSKAKLLDKEDIYNCWKETYAQDFATKGIFEDDIAAYEIGKTKYSLKDLNEISSYDIQGKYHQFATILRQHNVSGRENAFDKLVNLFLCKIVDETNNPEELKFYWKGIAYDNFFDLVDRLQKLYQEGMQKFLGEEVVYISATQIDEAFRHFKNDPDATKETIKKFFKELKFYNNNDFGFIDVHNEKLFYQNSAVLLKVVQMLQDIKLKTTQENQFLGDMFEGFLDQGVKQSEGQFFTPMPIVKFILKSLPLESIISKNDEIPKVIDYACGAGHFLNEYAKEIDHFVNENREVFHENIVGVEKEYRLSKVAKVSSFMYGQDNIKIIYADSLANNPNIKDNDYSILVANPPYSVKGFLETLSESERKKYQLIKTIDTKSFSNNNSIETFFIERAKQLLKPNGVAGIIVPSSILTKGKAKSTSKSKNIYVATREILLKYFDIVAIAEFGGGTFGKTGTNTVTLFLRRRHEDPAPSDHYLNRINSWFKGDRLTSGVFQDEDYIKRYCNHLELNFSDYQTLLEGKPNKALLLTEYFQGYQKEFDKWAEIKNRKKQKTFRELSVEDQKAEIQKKYIAYLIEIEKDKLYYFVLASINAQKVVIVRSPNKTAEIKKFLGYEWSSAKGNEGIKYLGGVNIEEPEDEEEGNVDLEDDDKRVLNNIFNLNNISTPLYDPQKKENIDKINTLIYKNFNNESVEISEHLATVVSSTSLINLIDFSRPDFNKAIGTSPKRIITIETKWESVKIGDINNLQVKKGTSITQNDVSAGNIPVVAGGISYAYYHNIFNREKNTITVSASGANAGYVNFWQDSIFASDCTTINSSDDEFIFYVYNLLKAIQFDIFTLARGAAQPHVYPDDIKEIKIPLPPSHIQKQIIEACQNIDLDFEEAKRAIIYEKNKIEQLIINFSQQEHPVKQVASLAEVNPSRTEIKDLDENTLVSFVEMASVSEEGFITYKQDRLLKNVKSGSYRYFKNNDILIAKITPCMENGKCAIAKDLTNGIGFGSSEFHIFRVNNELVLTEFLFTFLNREVIRKEAERNMTGSSGHRRVPDTFYKNLLVPVPSDINLQIEFMKNIDNCKVNIETAQNIISSTAKRKEEIIKKFL